MTNEALFGALAMLIMLAALGGLLCVIIGALIKMALE